MAYIYKITNQINNKVYIGETIRGVETRWKEHIRRAHSKEGDHGYYYHISCAIRKYGEENFTIEMLEECPDEIRFEREMYYIEYFDSTDPNNGYNTVLGGQGAILYPTKLFLDGWNQGLLIKEIAEKIGCSKKTARLRLKGAGIPREEIAARFGCAVAKRCAYPVLQYDLNGYFIQEWESASECGRANGFQQTAIGQVCAQKQKSAYGFLWKYKADERDIQEWVQIYQNKLSSGRPKKRIQQLTLDNSIIAEYDSGADAARALGLQDKTNICAAARKQRKAYGYYWRYIE